MSAEWVTVPDGKRQHIGIRIGTFWTPICGRQKNQWLREWLPASIARSFRRKTGVCANCLSVADAIYFLVVDR